MARRKKYKVIITPNDDPNAPTFDELMENEIKPLIAELLKSAWKNREKKAKIALSSESVYND